MFGSISVPELIVVLMSVPYFAWFIFVAVMLWKIWSKVRHLPG